jgi:hypothetical protein
MKDVEVLVRFVILILERDKGPRILGSTLPSLSYCLNKYCQIGKIDEVRNPIINYFLTTDELYSDYLDGIFSKIIDKDAALSERYLMSLDFKWYIEYVSLLVGSGTTLLKSNTSENILLCCRAYLRDLRLENLGI